MTIVRSIYGNRIAQIVFNSFFSIATIVVNLFLIGVILRKRQLRQNPKYILVLLLSGADFYVGVFLLPLWTHTLVTKTIDFPCGLVQTMYSTANIVQAISCFGIFAIGIEYVLRSKLTSFPRNIQIIVTSCLVVFSLFGPITLLVPIYVNGQAPGLPSCLLALTPAYSRALLVISYWLPAAAIIGIVISVIVIHQHRRRQQNNPGNVNQQNRGARGITLSLPGHPGTFNQPGHPGTFNQPGHPGTSNQMNQPGAFSQQNYQGQFNQQNPVVPQSIEGQFSQHVGQGTYNQQNNMGTLSQTNPIAHNPNQSFPADVLLAACLTIALNFPSEIINMIGFTCFGGSCDTIFVMTVVFGYVAETKCFLLPLAWFVDKEFREMATGRISPPANQRLLDQNIPHYGQQTIVSDPVSQTAYYPPNTAQNQAYGGEKGVDTKQGLH